MIVDIQINEGELQATTNGCGCCSETFYDKEDILKELKLNVITLKRTCELLQINILDLIGE